MLRRRVGRVVGILSDRPDVQEALVDIEGVAQRAVNYVPLSGEAVLGDKVLLNTTAVDLALGTGGAHFVICNLTRPESGGESEPGHIMKLRYTPLQSSVLAVEEGAGPHHDLMMEKESLEGMPVVCCELHSQIAAVAAGIKAQGPARVAYVMTDGGALPLALSRLVRELREKGLLDFTVTSGQAWGGDLEAVNVYTGLLAAKWAGGADVAVVCQGPGNAGTSTKYGFSGIQQAEALNAGGALDGRAIVTVRMSFADPRERHRGVSHHSLTVLGIATGPVDVPLPSLTPERTDEVLRSITPVAERMGHDVRVLDGEPGLSELSARNIHVTTMGRSVEEDREFFLAASAAGRLCSETSFKK